MEIFCEICGHREDGDAIFCTMCGTKLENREISPSKDDAFLQQNKIGIDNKGEISISKERIPPQNTHNQYGNQLPYSTSKKNASVNQRQNSQVFRDGDSLQTPYRTPVSNRKTMEKQNSLFDSVYILNFTVACLTTFIAIVVFIITPEGINNAFLSAMLSFFIITSIGLVWANIKLKSYSKIARATVIAYYLIFLALGFFLPVLLFFIAIIAVYVIYVLLLHKDTTKKFAVPKV